MGCLSSAVLLEGDAPAAGAEGLSGERARQTCSRVWEEWSRAGGGRTQRGVPRTQVCSQDIRELSLPSPQETKLVLPARWEKVPGSALAGREQLSLLMSLKGRFLTAASSTFPLGSAMLCGRLWWSFLLSSSFFRQPSQLYQNILTPLA